jgi:hypothetical protein
MVVVQHRLPAIDAAKTTYVGRAGIASITDIGFADGILKGSSLLVFPMPSAASCFGFPDTGCVQMQCGPHRAFSNAALSEI